MAGLSRWLCGFDHFPGDFQQLLSLLFPHQSGGMRVEFETLDDAAEYFPQGPCAEPVFLRRQVGDQAGRFLGDGEGDAGMFEIINRGGPDGTFCVVEYPCQVGSAQISQHDNAVEAGQELWRHTVLEDVLLCHVTAKIEDEAPVQAAIGTWLQTPELVRA